MTRTITHESNFGCIFNYDEIPNKMFNFYITKRHEYKDGTCLWNLCAELNDAPNHIADHNSDNSYIKMDSIRGTREDALARMDELVHSYHF